MMNVGDTRGDHLSAKRVGIDFIGVAWDLHSSEIIKREGNCTIADDFDSLYNSIKAL